MKQLTLFGEEVRRTETETERRSRQEQFEDYDAFLSKFGTKKTTDDCYTPDPVYRAVLDFVGTLTNFTDTDKILALSNRNLLPEIIFNNKDK